MARRSKVECPHYPPSLKSRSDLYVFYEDPYLTQCKATIQDINEVVQLDKTVAYPEGGGQEGDRGVIIDANRTRGSICDTQKGLGRTLYLKGFPVINVETPIFHRIVSQDNSSLRTGETVLCVLIPLEGQDSPSATQPAIYCWLPPIV